MSPNTSTAMIQEAKHNKLEQENFLIIPEKVEKNNNQVSHESGQNRESVADV